MPTDTYTYYGSATTSASGNTAIFAYNTPYIEIVNTGTAPLYITTNGSTVPVSTGGDGIFVVPGGATALVPNQLAATWHQSQSVIASGTLVGGTPVWTPAEMQPLGTSLVGGKSDPGTTINFISTGSGTTFVASPAG
jgi:hypothetical protein